MSERRKLLGLGLASFVGFLGFGTQIKAADVTGGTKDIAFHAKVLAFFEYIKTKMLEWKKYADDNLKLFNSMVRLANDTLTNIRSISSTMSDFSKIKDWFKKQLDILTNFSKNFIRGKDLATLRFSYAPSSIYLLDKAIASFKRFDFISNRQDRLEARVTKLFKSNPNSKEAKESLAEVKKTKSLYSILTYAKYNAEQTRWADEATKERTKFNKEILSKSALDDGEKINSHLHTVSLQNIEDLLLSNNKLLREVISTNMALLEANITKDISTSKLGDRILTAEDFKKAENEAKKNNNYDYIPT